MRIGVLGDIHANARALEAALKESKRVGCDRTVHTGDLVGLGPHPDEVSGLVQAERIEGVRGDFDWDAAWDLGLAVFPSDPIAGATGQSLSAESRRWTRNSVSETTRNFLKDLPFSMEFEAGGRSVSIAHGSPTDLYESVDAGTPDSRLREIIDDTPYEIYITGHAHCPGHRSLEGRHFINAGSVGFPCDGDPRGCLTVIDFSGGLTVEFVRFEYDLGSVAADAERHGLPQLFATLLRVGG